MTKIRHQERGGEEMKARKAERRRVSLVAQAMRAPWEDQCDQDTLERRLKEWEDSRRTPPGGTPTWVRMKLEKMLETSNAKAREDTR